MNLVFNILLVFCIGVTYSSAGTLGSDAAHTEKSPAEVQGPVDHKQTPPTPASLPVSSTISTVASSSIKDGVVTEEITVKSPVVVDSKNVSTDAKNTSEKTVTPKIQSTTPNNTTTLAPIQTKASQSTQKSTIVTTVGTTTSTSAPVVSAADHFVPTPTAQERQFDGPSFVGGIVLTVGLTVIGFIAFKFFKSGKIERNYRTL